MLKSLETGSQPDQQISPILKIEAHKRTASPGLLQVHVTIVGSEQQPRVGCGKRVAGEVNLMLEDQFESLREPKFL